MYVHFKNHPLPLCRHAVYLLFQEVSDAYIYVREACRAIFSFQSTREKTSSALSEENDVFAESGFFIWMVLQSTAGLFAAHSSAISQVAVIPTANLLTDTTLSNVVHSSG